MKKILITGASGYLGSEFIELYKDLYRFQTFSLLRSSIDEVNLDDIDCVLHCAALVHQTKPLTYKEYYKVNVEYPLALAKKAKAKGVSQFVFISTIAVYDNSINELTETAKLNPPTLYGKTKLEAEFQLQKLNEASFIVSVIRPPMIYGNNAPGNINKLKSIINKSPIIPLGGIKNKRTFVYIKNLCFGIDQVIRQELKGMFLISDDEAISTTKLISLIASTNKRKKHIIKIPFFKIILNLLKPNLYSKLYNDLVVNNKKTKIKLNYNNPYTLEEGIKDV